jgi:hypothetical protein
LVAHHLPGALTTLLPGVAPVATFNAIHAAFRATLGLPFRAVLATLLNPTIHSVFAAFRARVAAAIANGLTSILTPFDAIFTSVLATISALMASNVAPVVAPAVTP